MNYKVSLESYKDVFILPKSLVKQHLKLAGAVQLKVLLWLYCNGGEATAEEISKGVGLQVADIADAMHYWISTGLILTEDKENEIAESEVEAPAKKQEVIKENEKKETQEKIEKKVSSKSTVVLEPQRPNRMEAIRRADESAEIAWLFREAEGLFGRFVSDAERISIVWMVDNLGLESGVVRMIIQHCASIDKCNVRYIEKMALSWANEEIDTIEKAEAHLILMEQLKKEWATVCSAFGIEYRLPTDKEQNYAHTWIKEWKFNKKMLKTAYDVCVDTKGKFIIAYVHKVLEQWHKDGITTPEMVTSASEERKKTKADKKTSQDQGNKSYNIDEYEELLLKGRRNKE